MRVSYKSRNLFLFQGGKKHLRLIHGWSNKNVWTVYSAQRKWTYHGLFLGTHHGNVLSLRTTNDQRAGPCLYMTLHRDENVTFKTEVR